MGGGGKTQTTVENKDPWWGQQPHLLKAFNEANSIYDTQKAQNDPGYTGNFVATATKPMYNAMNQSLNWNMNQGMDAINKTQQTGNQQIDAGTAGLNEVQKGLTDFNSRDWTQTHIDNAGRYSQNPFMDAMIEATGRDAQRTFSEETMRGIDQNAALSGNMNSTRAGIAAGVAQRGLTDKMADVSATMRGNAWSQGLQMSQGDQQALLAGLQAKGGLSSDQLKTGLYGLAQGQEMMGQNLDQRVLASSMLQGFDQAKIDNDLAKFEYKQSKPWANLGNFYNIVGDKSWGGTTTGVSKTKENPSTMSTIGSGVAILGSLFRCDARVKHLIKVTRHTKEGLPVYLFAYRDAPHMGLMEAPTAQDVQRHFPDAVTEINGVLHIDTNKYDWR